MDMTLDEILPLLLIFNTIINVCILWYTIGISTDIKRNHFSLEDMLSMIYQSLLHQFNELSNKKTKRMSNKEYHKSIMSKTSLTDVLYDYKHIAESIVDDATYQSADTGVLLYHLGCAIEYLEELDTLRKAFLMACETINHGDDFKEYDTISIMNNLLKKVREEE